MTLYETLQNLCFLGILRLTANYIKRKILVTQQIKKMQLKICSKCGQSNVELTINMTWQDCSVLNCVKCENRWYVCFKHNKRFSVKSYT